MNYEHGISFFLFVFPLWELNKWRLEELRHVHGESTPLRSGDAAERETHDFFFFFFNFYFFFWCNGVVCVTLLWGFSDCDPPHPRLTLNNPPHPPLHPPNHPPNPTTLSYSSRALGGEITLYSRCRWPGAPRWGPSSPRPWRSSPPSRLWRYRPSQFCRWGDGEVRENQKETRRKKKLC